MSNAELTAANYALASDLSEWKERVRKAWSEVRVDHVESEGAADVITAGTNVEVRAFVSLGELSPDDVFVEVLSGRVDSDDRIQDPTSTPMQAVEQYEQNRWKFQGSLSVDHNGAFGYTVRLLPRHAGMVAPVEMGLMVVPASTQGMVDGPLR
jgi:starch phosphorylase